MQYDFLIKGQEAEKLGLEQLARDADAARLSRAFQLYYLLRPLVPLSVRQLLQRNRKIEVPRQWYVPDAFTSALWRCIRDRSEPLTLIHPWPNAAQFAFVLTHDVETREGVENIAKVAKIEEELGFRSSWNIVPYKYKVDKGLIRDLESRSFEIGIHGYNHDGRLYSSWKLFQQRAVAINAALGRYGAVGFRSPMVHRNLKWLQSLDIQYDASCFDVDPFQAMPGGIGSIWPFIAGKFVELPYTLPQDHTLFIALGQQDCRIWHDKLNYIVKHHGMALMLTHPDYLSTQRHLDLYREFLTAVREKKGYWHALPKHVSQWWREREDSTLRKNSRGQWEISGPAHDSGVGVAAGLCDEHSFTSFHELTP